MTDCKCIAGFGWSGFSCTACLAGMFKSVLDTAECRPCPANSESAVGSAICYCSPGYEGSDGGACVACSDCTEVVTLIATLDMTFAELTNEKQNSYVDGVAHALLLAPTCVQIASIEQQTLRRQLLVASVAVKTTVTVALNPPPHHTLHVAP